MTDFNKILEKAKEIEKKMKESQENLKKLKLLVFLEEMWLKLRLTEMER